MIGPFFDRCDEAYGTHDGYLLCLRFEMAIFHRADELRESPETRLYVIHEPVEDAVKIGIGQNPKGRLSSLQIGSPRPLELLIDVPAYAALETFIHSLLREQRIRGEWFRCTMPTLVMCELLSSAADTQRDCLRMGDEFDADFTIGCLTSAADDFLSRLAADERAA